ncbi:hypothetical protein DW920_14450 [Clostridium sp. AM42-36]|nr:hypothetical protein DW920_14450 [Clostridium sp. AM42-36]
MNSITIGLEPYTFAKVQRMRERTLAIFQVWNLMFFTKVQRWMYNIIKRVHGLKPYVFTKVQKIIG